MQAFRQFPVNKEEEHTIDLNKINLEFDKNQAN